MTEKKKGRGRPKKDSKRIDIEMSSKLYTDLQCILMSAKITHNLRGKIVPAWGKFLEKLAEGVIEETSSEIVFVIKKDLQNKL